MRENQTHSVMPCIVCVPHPACARTGNTIHWDQHLPLTVMEARRAQDVPDDEVIVGLRSKKYKIVGSSVPRSVALALGLSLRYAWPKDANNPEEDKWALKSQRPCSQRATDFCDDDCSQPGLRRPRQTLGASNSKK